MESSSTAITTMEAEAEATMICVENGKPPTEDVVAEQKLSVGSKDHGLSSKNWTKKETETATDKKIRENLYRLPSIGYDALARELRLEESVLRDGVAKFFELEKENRSEDVKKVFERQWSKKILEKETEEKKEKEKVDLDTKIEKDLRQMALHRVLTYMGWTKYDSFSKIAIRHDISIEDQEKIVIFFIEFKKYLGFGEEIEDGESDVKDERPN